MANETRIRTQAKLSRRMAYHMLSEAEQKQIDKACDRLAIILRDEHLSQDDLMEILASLGIWMAQQKGN